MNHRKKMTIGGILSVVFLSLLIQLVPVHANAESVNTLTKYFPENKPVVDKLPLPQNLVSEWWKYFDVTNPLFAKHLEQASQEYSALLVPLSPDESKEASYQLNRFLNSLKTLQELYNSPPQKANTEQHPFQESYSINEWLAIAIQLRKQTLIVEDKKERLAYETMQLKTREKHLDTLKIAYLNLDNAEENKISLGFELMAERFAINVDTEQLRLKQALFEQDDEQLKKLQLLNKTASEQLSSDKDLIDELDTEQQKLRSKLNKAQKSFRQINLETVIENNPLSLSNARLQAQKTISTSLEVASLEVQLQVIDAKQVLSMLLATKPGDDLSSIQEKLTLWRAQALENKQNAQSWYKDTETELDQAQERMITLVAENTEGMESAERTENRQRIEILKQRISLAQACLVSLKQMEIDRYTLQNLTQVIEQKISDHSGKWQRFFDWSDVQFTSLKKSLVGWSSQPLFTIGETPVTVSGLFQVAIILSVASFLSALFRKGMKRLTERSERNMKGHSISAFYSIGRLAHYVILLLGIIIALASIGLDFTNLAIVAGALSLGVGFGLQSIVNNFVSGLILLFEGTIKIGDFVELESGVMGVVQEINVRSTQIKNVTDNIDIIVPNSLLVSNKVINWTLQEKNRRIHVPFRVAYGTDKEIVKKAVLEAAARVPYTHKPKYTDAAHCWLVKFGDSSLDFELVVWIEREAVLRPGMIQALYLWEIETSLNEHKIEIPFPQRDIHIRSIVEDNT